MDHISVTRTNQYFSHDDMLIDFDESSVVEITDDEKIDCVARRILNKYRQAFEELAK